MRASAPGPGSYEAASATSLVATLESRNALSRGAAFGSAPDGLRFGTRHAWRGPDAPDPLDAPGPATYNVAPTRPAAAARGAGAGRPTGAFASVTARMAAPRPAAEPRAVEFASDPILGASAAFFLTCSGDQFFVC